MNPKKILLGSCLFILTSIMMNPSAKAQVNQTRDQISRRIVDNLRTDKFQAIQDECHILVKPAFPVGQLNQMWSNVLVQLGEFESIKSITETKNQTYQVVSVRCKFRKDNATIELTYNEDNKIIALYIKP